MKIINETVQDSDQPITDVHLENSETHSKTNSENLEGENQGIPIYSAENSELDALLGDATTTKQEKSKTEQQEKAAASEYMSEKQANKIALEAANDIEELATDLAGKPIVLSKRLKSVFAALTTPAIQKYGEKLKVNNDKVDLKSWKPELMAVGGAAVLGVPIFLQSQDDEEEVQSNGNKS